MQPMLMLGVRDIATLLSHYAATWLPNQYNKLFDRASGLRMLSIAQVVFLVNISLCAGRVLALSDCLEGHARDVTGGAFFHLTEEWRNRIIWLRRGVAQPASVPVEERNCLDACRLVVGLEAENIFVGNNVSYRFFALFSDLAEDYVVTQVEPTRALFSPSLLSTIVAAWPKNNEHDSVCCHCACLQRTLEKHTDLAFALALAGPDFVHHDDEEFSKLIVSRWYATITLAFEDLTFHALCLRFACALAQDTATGHKLLDGTLSHIRDEGLLSTVFRRGPLVLVENVANFPSMFDDAYSGSDANEEASVLGAASTELEKHRRSCPQELQTSKCVNEIAALEVAKPAYKRICTPSYELLQVELAKGNHFCFKPYNPNNHCEDGVIFLRDVSGSWTVLLLQTNIGLVTRRRIIRTMFSTDGDGKSLTCLRNSSTTMGRFTASATHGFCSQPTR